jgi:hypothetical protein
MSDDQKVHLEVLADHYSKSFELLKEDVGKRDRLFLYMLILIFVLLLYMSAPDAVSKLINMLVANQTGEPDPGKAGQIIDVSFIGTIFWFGFLGVSHTYFQTVLHVERQYNYIYQLEKMLSEHFDEKAFVREGKHYRDNRRKFSSWTKFIFWMLSPFLMFLFLVSWQVFLIRNTQTEFVYLATNSLISLSIIISMVLFLWALYKKK